MWHELHLGGHNGCCLLYILIITFTHWPWKVWYFTGLPTHRVHLLDVTVNDMTLIVLYIVIFRSFKVKCLLWKNLKYWGHTKTAAAEILLSHSFYSRVLSHIYHPLFEADVITKPSLQPNKHFSKKRDRMWPTCLYFSSAPFQRQKVGEHVCLVAYCQTQGNASLHLDTDG